MPGFPALEYALRYAARGLHVFPCHSVREDGACTCPRAHECKNTGKHPHTFNGVKDATDDVARIHAWWTQWPYANVAIAAGRESGVIIIDVDPRHDGHISLERFEQERGEFLPPTQTANTGGGGKHLFYAYPEQGCPGRNPWLPGVEVKSDGGYVIAPPSRHASGLAYAWNPAPEGVNGFSQLPIDVLESIGSNRSGIESGVRSIAEMMAGVPEGQRDDELYRQACSLRRKFDDNRELIEIVILEWAKRCDPPFPPDEALRKVDQAFKADHSDPPSRLAELEKLELHALTDDGNALRFVEQHHELLRHVSAWGWMVWTGTHWERDDTLLPQEMARKTVRMIPEEATHEGVGDELATDIMRWGVRSQAKERVKAITDLARSDPRIVLRTDDFDADPWSLNTYSGIVDLKTGSVVPHNRDRMMSKVASARYDSAANCPRWIGFLERILPDEEVRAFVQRAVGYSLTGITREKVMFILWGTGDNGKTVFIEVLRCVLGMYAMAAPSSMLVNRKQDAIPNDIARLKGARFVTAAETRTGAQLAVDLIKQMTGGDTMTVRFMRAEWFDFTPEFKLWLATNHAPRVTDFGDAIWNRLRLVPFDVKIPKEEQIPRDRFIAEMVEEAAGIMRWAIDGCLSWQEIGLKPPASVVLATEAYRDDQDVFLEFLEECCVVGGAEVQESGGLYSGFSMWQARRGEKPWSMRAFTEELKDRGFVKGRGTKGERIWRGLRLKNVVDVTDARI